jgi:YVTN family beta-propeller protein
MSVIGTDQRIGTELLGYRIEALIGRGGMGVVYRAYDGRLKRNVALKLVAPELAANPAFRERFLAESELAASLEHPSVVPIHDAGEVDRQLVLAMRYVEGSDLKTLLAEEGPFEPKRTLEICAQVAGALDAAHERGLVHRDVKPSNVLLDEAEHVYLADFGLTRRISEGGGLGPSLGTPAYAAPEQIEGGKVDGRADVYSLACLLYECLAGEPPFPRESELATLWAQLNDPPPGLADYPALEPVLAKALAKDPAERYGSCRELVEAAAEALGIRDVVVVHDRRPLLLAAAGAVLVVAAVLLGVLLTRGGGTARPSTKPTVAITTGALQRIDPKTNKLVAATRLGSSPASLAAGEGAVWVTDERESTISRIDPRTNSVTTKASAGPAAGGPSYVIAGEGSVWVSNTGGGGLTRFDPRTLTNLGALPLASTDSFNCGPVAAGEGGIWVYASGALYRATGDNLVAKVEGTPLCSGDLAAGAGAVWVTNSYFASELLRVDPKTLRIAKRLPLDFPPGAVTTDDSAVWIVDGRDDSVVEVSPTSGRIFATVKVGGRPDAIATGGGSVWVANVDDGTVSRIDPRRRKVVATINVGPNPTHIAVGEGGVFVTVHPD